MAKLIINRIVELLLLIHVLSSLRLGVDALEMGYHVMSFPFAERIVGNTISQALRKDPTLAAGLLRLHFHDCFIEGSDGSVLIDSTKDNMAEKASPANLSL